MIALGVAGIATAGACVIAWLVIGFVKWDKLARREAGRQMGERRLLELKAEAEASKWKALAAGVDVDE